MIEPSKTSIQEQSTSTAVLYSPLPDSDDPLQDLIDPRLLIKNPASSVSTMSVLLRAAAVLMTVHVAYLAVDQATLFSLHPVTMSLGYLLFMAEAILTLSGGQQLPLLGHLKKTTAHWILQVIATSLILIGFLSIVIVKFQHDKPHFASWHAILGLIAVCCVLGTNCGGIGALYSTQFKSKIKPSYIKAIHGLFGMLTFAIGLLTLGLGFYTNWFSSRANEVFSLTYAVLLLIIGYKVLANSAYNIVTRLKN